jgi:Oxidoreductase family, NAD-binding Rossmann fold/Oxidoreductase family, C-terminal alpha/beta domain
MHLVNVSCQAKIILKTIEMKRSEFLKKSSVALAGLAGVTILPSSVLGLGKNGIAPSDKVNLACIGIGNRGADIIKKLHSTGLANIVALCDVEMGAPNTLEIMKMFPNVPRFQDFRVMFDKMGKQFDAITAGVPDFSHFPITMLAMSEGKHVYVEKPMAHTFHEVELMMAAEKKYKVACQMGNQGHSEENYFQFKAWKDAGIIKDVTAITAFMNNGRRWHGMKVSDFLPAQPIPETMDWDKWLTTAQFKEFNKGYINGDWRSWFEFGNGALGDWGAHIIDTAHQFLELGMPTEVDPIFMDGHSPLIFPQASTLLFKFPKRKNMPALDLTWYDGFNNQPKLPDGYGEPVRAKDIPPPTSGNINTKRYPGKIIYSKELVFKGGSHSAPLAIIPEAKAKDMASMLPNVPLSPSNHFANFLKACKGEEKCRSSFDIAGPLCQVMALGVLAQRLNTKLIFDSKRKQITNSKIGNELLVGPPPRKGWEQYYKL